MIELSPKLSSDSPDADGPSASALPFSVKPSWPFFSAVQFVTRIFSVARDSTNPSPRLPRTVVFAMLAFFANRCMTSPFTRLFWISLLVIWVWLEPDTNSPNASPVTVLLVIDPVTRSAAGTCVAVPPGVSVSMSPGPPPVLPPFCCCCWRFFLASCRCCLFRCLVALDGRSVPVSAMPPVRPLQKPRSLTLVWSIRNSPPTARM
ncbi:hypothetical protein amrb99_95120 [Actinomadura sp. RB99]|nr:hypothetical protein [Actinomadura sp. RB99]